MYASCMFVVDLFIERGYKTVRRPLVAEVFVPFCDDCSYEFDDF